VIYADYNGTSTLCPEVKNYLLNRLESGPFANPNAIHRQGNKVMAALTKCRSSIAQVLGAKPSQIIFNSGASEGISHVFNSVLASSSKNCLIISGIEHSAVVSCAKFWESKGKKLIVCPVNQDGEVILDELAKLLKQNTDDVALVSIMAANNETGVLQPYQAIGELCQQHNCLYFSDTTQLIGKLPFNFEESKMDFAVASSHKIGALIGSGLILAKDISLLDCFIFGGGQERGLRGGTQNYIGIESMAIALDAFQANSAALEASELARTSFENKIKQDFPQVVILGEKAPRLATTTLISYPGIHGQAVQIELESQDIFVTTSSACSDNEPNTSKVLKSMGIDDVIGRGVVRISLCLCQKRNPAKYEAIYLGLKNAYNKLKKIESF
jgi:cysteine desulfurase